MFIPSRNEPDLDDVPADGLEGSRGRIEAAGRTIRGLARTYPVWWAWRYEVANLATAQGFLRAADGRIRRFPMRADDAPAALTELSLAGYRPFYLTAQLIVATSFWAAWRLAREYVSAWPAVCASLLLENNRIRLDRRKGAERYEMQGVEMHGFFGPRLLLRTNHLSGFRVGFLIVPLSRPASPMPASRLWIVSENIAEKASTVVQAPISTSSSRTAMPTWGSSRIAGAGMTRRAVG